MKRVVGAALGALTGLAFSTMGLVDTSQGLTWSGGGNEATSLVIAVGVTIGALLGGIVFWRFPFAILGAIVGLATGIWLRDNLTLGSVQPPWVFLLLFGLPAIGIVAGYSLHLPRATWMRYPVAAGALLGLAAAAASYAAASTLWATATHDPACDPISQPDGSVAVRLCPETGQPLWIALLAALLGVAVGMAAHRRLDFATAPPFRSEPRTS